MKIKAREIIGTFTISKTEILAAQLAAKWQAKGSSLVDKLEHVLKERVKRAQRYHKQQIKR